MSMISKIASSALLVSMTMLTPGDVSAGGKYRKAGSCGLKTLPYFEKIQGDETVELLSHGPFKIAAFCDTANMEGALMMTVTAEDDDEWVFGFPDFPRHDEDGACVGSFSAKSSETCKIWGTGAGTSDTGTAGAFQSLSGYYVGFGGNTIAFSKDYLDTYGSTYNYYDDDDLAAYPSEYTCVIAGVLDYFVDK